MSLWSWEPQNNKEPWQSFSTIPVGPDQKISPWEMSVQQLTRRWKKDYMGKRPLASLCFVRFTDVIEPVFSSQPWAEDIPIASTDTLAMGGRLRYDSKCQHIIYNVDINPKRLVIPEVCCCHQPLRSLVLEDGSRWRHSPCIRGTRFCANNNLNSQIFSFNEKTVAPLA